MNIDRLAHRFTRILSNNSPTILTAIGAAGVVTTAYLAGRATWLAAEQINEHNREEDVTDLYISPRKAIELCWKFYIPVATSGTITIAAIIAANRIGTRKAAAVATALAISERTFDQYKEKIVERLGENKERAVRDEIAQDNVRDNPPSKSTVIFTDGGSVLCRDEYSGRYFQSSMESLKRAQNNVNYRILHDGDASLTDFYNEIGIPKTSHSDDVGWNSDHPLELSFSHALSENDRPCITFDFVNPPTPVFYLH